VPLRLPGPARHHREGALQPDALNEFIQRLPAKQAKDAVEMKRGKAGHARDLFEPDRPLQIVQDEIDRAIDAVGIIERFGRVLFLGCVSQDL